MQNIVCLYPEILPSWKCLLSDFSCDRVLVAPVYSMARQVSRWESEGVLVGAIHEPPSLAPTHIGSLPLIVITSWCTGTMGPYAGTP